MPQAGKICVLGAGGNLRLIALGTEEVIERDIEPEFSSLIPLGKTIGALGREGSSLLLLDAARIEPIWWTRTDAAITSVGANDSHVAVCVSVNRKGQEPENRLLLYGLR